MNEGISKVLLAILFPKLNQFTCDKMLVIFAQTGVYP